MTHSLYFMFEFTHFAMLFVYALQWGPFPRFIEQNSLLSLFNVSERTLAVWKWKLIFTEKSDFGIVRCKYHRS